MRIYAREPTSNLISSLSARVKNPDAAALVCSWAAHAAAALWTCVGIKYDNLPTKELYVILGKILSISLS